MEVVPSRSESDHLVLLSEVVVTIFAQQHRARHRRIDLAMHAGPLRIDGLSIPSNQVRTLAVAFNATLQLGDPDACQPCADTAAFVAEEFATVYTEAVEEAELEFQTNFGPLEVSIDTFVESIVNATAPAFATVRCRCGA